MCLCCAASLCLLSSFSHIIFSSPASSSVLSRSPAAASFLRPPSHLSSPSPVFISAFSYIVTSFYYSLLVLSLILSSNLSSFFLSGYFFSHLFIHLLTSPSVCTFRLIPHSHFFHPPSLSCLPYRSWIINHPVELECCCDTHDRLQKAIDFKFGSKEPKGDFSVAADLGLSFKFGVWIIPTFSTATSAAREVTICLS